ncbi:ABC transporter permease [Siculibacillus lacustris]|uniref:ABC transporter permease n=1 Tax=Siculibacillus lacustris TaxID=1549641 RepID=A0A4Q9VTU9_9HYPH|nr:ABC transporter permease [Siculibacillus lacustris]TBW39521.1 ABC transporter permease [Siculibacillus lacustris]
MGRFFLNVFRLAIKELQSLRHDPMMLFLIVYAFSAAVIMVADGVKLEVVNATMGVVDDDRSQLSRRMTDAFAAPYFKTPEVIDRGTVDRAMDVGRYGFVLEFPPGFEADVLRGRVPAIGLTIDATVMVQAGNGAAYIQSILLREATAYLQGTPLEAQLPIAVVSRVRFNPNIEGRWFSSIMQLTNSITILSILLVGAAVIREREHGTIEHLLVMPVGAFEIALAKVLANGAVLLLAVVLSMELVVRGWLGVPIAGSRALFLCGTVFYLFSTTSLGILIATLARSMPQFALMAIPVFTTMMLLSGNMTPLESMPQALQWAMHVSPSVYYVQFAQGLLYRGATLEIVWQPLAIMVGLGVVYLAFAVHRFRIMLAHAG